MDSIYSGVTFPYQTTEFSTSYFWYIYLRHTLSTESSIDVNIDVKVWVNLL
eukprot:14651.XXX_103001_102605_1 [CDS] Oithona nana genome sequencing.